MSKGARLKIVRKLAADMCPPVQGADYLFSHSSKQWFVKGRKQLGRRIRMLHSRGMRGDALVLQAVKYQVRQDRKKEQEA